MKPAHGPIGRISTELLVTILTYLPAEETLTLRPTSQFLRVVVALRYRREMMTLMRENEQTVLHLKSIGRWDELDTHPLKQAQRLLKINEETQMIYKSLRKNEVSAYTAPSLVNRLLACFFAMRDGKADLYFKNGACRVETIENALQNFDPKQNVGNLTDTVLSHAKEIMAFSESDVETIMKSGELAKRFYSLCMNILEWHEREFTVQIAKAQLGYFKMERNKYRFNELSGLFLRILKKDIPASMF